MPYSSVDALQKALAETIFQNRQDVKKAAGRTLGTIVELITFYILCEWELLPNLSIERGLAEFANDSITHNVEFGLHRLIAGERFTMAPDLPLSTTKIVKALAGVARLKPFQVATGMSNKSMQLLSSEKIVRNACALSSSDENLIVANLYDLTDENAVVDIAKLRTQPFCMVECKRVGIEEGMKKGPTTIEKAKQGAYVAKHVSALQKVRGRDGILYGVMPKKDGSFEINELAEELRRLIYDAPVGELDGFILTVGVVSNHGNWFTAGDPNKEILVLRQSYDWLLFLTDAAIAQFVSDTLLSKDSRMSPVTEAFKASYASGESGKNQFTKVKIGLDAHLALKAYFHKHINCIEKDWFNVLSPAKGHTDDLKRDLRTLAAK